MQVVNITIELKDAQQSHDFEKYLRGHMLPEYKIDFVNLRNTKQLYEDDKYFRKLVKNAKEANKIKNDYIYKK
tara:strand:- start:219 stop:437 length:219 start_codon:yes stop_codon:yes gene_type:complete